MWQEEHLEGGDGMIATATFHDTFPLTSGLSSTSFTIYEDTLTTTKLYHLELRSVREEGNQIVEAGPTAVWTFATPSSDVHDLVLESGHQGVEIRIYLIDEVRFLSASEEDERLLTPSTVKGDKLPPMDEPPDPFASAE